MTVTTDPIPVFPTAGAHQWTERTPMAREVEKATEAAIEFAVALRAHAGHLSNEQVADLVTATIGDYLDDYARTLEKAAMEATLVAEGCGVIAIWHGTAYSVGFTNGVPPGYLVEQRCHCGRKP